MLKFPGVHSDLSTIIDTLKNAGTIVYPTDTIWGLGCDARNEEAVAKIFSIKKRKKNSPLIVLLHDENQLFDYVKEIPDVAFDLIELSTNPLTIIFENGKNVAPSILGDDGSIAIRLCTDASCLQLLRKWRKPLVSTSVNISGETAALSLNDISPEILDKVDAIYNADYIINASSPSQIIKLDANGSVSIIRK